MNNKVLVAIYILSTPKLDKNVPETTKYTFYDILASNQDILVIFSPLYIILYFEHSRSNGNVPQVCFNGQLDNFLPFTP